MDPIYYDLIKRPIAQNYFQVGKGVTVGHVQAVFGQGTVGVSQEVLDALVRKVKHDKANAKQWGMQEVKENILRGYCSSVPSDPCTYTWKELMSKWAEDEGGDMVKRMWHACYGNFDDQHGWDKELERIYMDNNRLTYDKPLGKSKGCYSRLFTHCKSETIKAINRIAERTHRNVIRMKRTSDEVKSMGRYKKRKKGTTLGGFCSNHVGTKPFNPESPYEREETVRRSPRKHTSPEQTIGDLQGEFWRNKVSYVGRWRILDMLFAKYLKSFPNAICITKSDTQGGTHTPIPIPITGIQEDLPEDMGELDLGDLSSPIGSDLACSPELVIRTKIREHPTNTAANSRNKNTALAQSRDGIRRQGIGHIGDVDDESTGTENETVFPESSKRPKTSSGFAQKELDKVRTK